MKQTWYSSPPDIPKIPVSILFIYLAELIDQPKGAGLDETVLHVTLRRSWFFQTVPRLPLEPGSPSSLRVPVSRLFG